MYVYMCHSLVVLNNILNICVSKKCCIHTTLVISPMNLCIQLFVHYPLKVETITEVIWIQQFLPCVGFDGAVPHSHDQVEPLLVSPPPTQRGTELPGLPEDLPCAPCCLPERVWEAGMVRATAADIVNILTDTVHAYQTIFNHHSCQNAIFTHIYVCYTRWDDSNGKFNSHTFTSVYHTWSRSRFVLPIWL